MSSITTVDSDGGILAAEVGEWRIVRLEDALERATDLLSRLSPSNDPGRLMITRAELREHGWLFFYDSSTFVRFGSFLDALGGNLPILVPSDGVAVAVPYDEVPLKAGEPIHPDDQG